MPDNYRELLVGCGRSRQKRFWLGGEAEFRNLTTLDMSPSVGADIEANLDRLPYDWAKDNEYDEIHAYEILEHTGRQGDWRFFFDQFSEFWRILKPGGQFVASVPHWDKVYAFLDPGHTRVLPVGLLNFLNQPFISEQQAIGSTMCDYRHYYRADFQPEATNTEGEASVIFMMRAIKPARLA